MTQPPSFPPAAPPPGPSAGPTREECDLGMLCHLLGLLTGFVGPLILWLVKKDESRFIDHHGKEAPMRNVRQGRLRRQLQFLQGQYLQGGELPLRSLLSESVALATIDSEWRDRIYPPLVTLGCNRRA